MAVRNLVPLRIVVGLDETTAHHKYPNFNLISSVIRKGMDWSKYLDVYGGGMHYDKTCGHKEETVESPYGSQVCCLCVPQDFATEALSMFPSTVTAITPAEFEVFHDGKAHAHEPDESVDSNTLNALSSRRSLMKALGQDLTTLDARIVRALDPNIKTEPGVTKNLKKKWADAKSLTGIELKTSV